MSEPMGKQEIAEANQEHPDPLPFEDWSSTEQAKNVLMDAYIEASDVLQTLLKPLPASYSLSRAGHESEAYKSIDCALDDAYQEFLEMHPSKIGHITETFSRIYGVDGL